MHPLIYSAHTASGNRKAIQQKLDGVTVSIPDWFRIFLYGNIPRPLYQDDLQSLLAAHSTDEGGTIHGGVSEFSYSHQHILTLLYRGTTLRSETYTW